MILKLRKWLAPILTVIAYGILVLLQLGTIDINDRATTRTFVVNLITSVIIIVSISSIWIPFGIEKGMLDEKFLNNQRVYNEKANAISDNMEHDQLREFCYQANIQHELDLKYNYLERYGLSKNDLNDFERFPSKYTSKQLKALKHAKSHYFKFKKLRAEVVLSAREKIKGIAPENKGIQRISLSLSGRILSTAFVSAFTTYLILRQKTFDINTAIQLVMWTFTIAMNIYSSISMGNTSVVVDKNNYYLDLNQVCVDYEAWKLKTKTGN